MRSRYSAFALLDADYLVRTWHRTTRPVDLVLDRRQRWLGLQILATSGGSFFAGDATVEFIASYQLAGKKGELREVSRFVRESGRWFYLDGDVAPDPV